MNKKVVILGIGNLLLSDEGIGIKTLEELSKNFEFPEEVELVDGGTLGLGLLEFVEQATHLLVVDAIEGGGKPGTLYEFKGKDLLPQVAERLSLHEVSFLDILNLAKLRGKIPEEIVILGVEPGSLEMSTNLTEEVKSKIPELITRILAVLKDWGIEVKKK